MAVVNSKVLTIRNIYTVTDLRMDTGTEIREVHAHISNSNSYGRNTL